ncbi:hypothetical protein [Thiohalorhabdus methylotrophus]|uniref:Uncharacterized protein n=1 Tax=Thiohalorhabdus methylotrophus TaxID=3242694 RepID=A0ABV4TZT8_9GAMM
MSRDRPRPPPWVGEASVLCIDGGHFLERRAAGDLPALQMGWLILTKLARHQSAMNREILDLAHAAQDRETSRDEVSLLRDKLFAEWSF